MATHVNNDGSHTVILNTKWPCCGTKARVTQWAARVGGGWVPRRCRGCRTEYKTRIVEAHPHTQEIMGVWEVLRVEWRDPDREEVEDGS